jgi:uncharacterized protein (DUF1697 family)
MMDIALVRGINVGGKKKIAMADLRALLESMGLADVKSLLQSGNLVFSDSQRTASATLERTLQTEAASRLALEAEFFVRTGKEWDAIVAANPFGDEARSDPGHLVLMCLKRAPAAVQVKALQNAIVGRELVHADGKELYIVFPDGIGPSRLTTAVIERLLGTRATGRNWNTVLKLQAAACAPDGGQ